MLLWTFKSSSVIFWIWIIRTGKTLVEIESDFGITTDIPYLTLTGELWGDYCDDFDEIGCIMMK